MCSNKIAVIIDSYLVIKCFSEHFSFKFGPQWHSLPNDHFSCKTKSQDRHNCPAFACARSFSGECCRIGRRDFYSSG